MKEGFKPREYQKNLFEEAKDKSSLLVLPTGLGKTIVAAMIIDYVIKEEEDTCLFLAPTRPLVEQHIQTVREFIPRLADWTMGVDGSVDPSKRQKIVSMNRVICATPQTIRNDIQEERIDLSKVKLLIIDEAHRAVGNYAYTDICSWYGMRPRSQILSLTASPGDDEQKIREIIHNVRAERLIYKKRDDPDVEPYTHETNIDFQEVKLGPGLKDVKTFLQSSFEQKVEKAIKLGYVRDNKGKHSRRVLLKYMHSLQAKVSNGEKHHRIFQTMSLIAEALKIQHAIGLVESHGLQPLQNYFEGVKEDAEKGASKAVQKLLEDGYFQAAMRLTEKLLDNGYEHPKFEKLRMLVSEQVRSKEKSKIIIFTQYRDAATTIVEKLEDDGVSSHIFVGQSKKKGTGLSQKEQKEVLEDFRNAEFTCLVSTSVGEEGLDIPQVDLVVFFEPVPSAIRTVQRRGRTGRKHVGKVITLVTKDTRDEAYRWSSHHKEKRMYRAIKAVKDKLEGAEPGEEESGQKTLGDF